MKRLAFTIILNGLHHLQYKNFAEDLAQNFDLWVIAEGASKSGGSTFWCNEMPSEYHDNGRSKDGTVEYLKSLTEKHSNVILVQKDGMWDSKDEQVNAAMLEIKKRFDSGLLWQIDCDEWMEDSTRREVERQLVESGFDHARFYVEQYVGKDLVTRGDSWGEKGPYWIRLWKWSGQIFEKHEPPILKGGNGTELLVSDPKLRIHHFSYAHEVDVKFKDLWYGGHRGVYEAWKSLQDEKHFPQPLKRLIPWAADGDYIEKV